ncbi:hypothetical protein GCM10009789_56340 [Kribbella sancticallisti]|uniref:Uncharacterized protein n=1 Tax=Kribbella sancticallisti TaxID=460087 RepID=A0ABP4PZX8_9ACTN
MCTSDTSSSAAGLDWVPASCTLPTVEQPIRVAEFDDLFTASVRGVERIDPSTLRLTVAADAEAHARDLAGRESRCCSFFGFDFIAAGDAVAMTVTVPAAHVAVLDAFAARATTAAGLGAPVSG